MNALRLKNLNSCSEFHAKVKGDFDKCYELGFCLMKALGQDDNTIAEMKSSLTKADVKEQANVNGIDFPIDKFLTYIDEQLSYDHEAWKKAIEICLQ